jgi:hypothetical protein
MPVVKNTKWENDLLIDVIDDMFEEEADLDLDDIEEEYVGDEDEEYVKETTRGPIGGEEDDEESSYDPYEDDEY